MYTVQIDPTLASAPFLSRVSTLLKAEASGFGKKCMRPSDVHCYAWGSSQHRHTPLLVQCAGTAVRVGRME